MNRLVRPLSYPSTRSYPTCRLRGDDAIHWLAVRPQTYWNRLRDLIKRVGQELGDVGTGAWAVLQGDVDVRVGQELGDVGT